MSGEDGEFERWEAAWSGDVPLWHNPLEARDLRRFLRHYFPDGVTDEATALVPLCGDANVVRVLYDYGFSVVGVEWVAKPLEHIRTSQFPELRFSQRRAANGTLWIAPRVQLIHGDFFDVSEEERFDIVFDRASFVAIPPKSRQQYVAIVRRSLRPQGLWSLLMLRQCSGALRSLAPYSILLSELDRLTVGMELVARESRRERNLAPHLVASGVGSIVYTRSILRKR